MDAPPVQYVKTKDGYNIAYAVSGSGTPLVLIPTMMTHLQNYWTADTWVRPWLHGLTERFQLVRYDGRGQGMSTRGLTPDLNRDDFTTDLHAVVQKLGLRSFVLMGTQSFGHVGVRYVVEHPGEVRALVLVSCPISMESWPLGALNSLGDRDWEALLRALAGLSQAGDVTASVQRQKDSITQADWLAIRRLTDTSSVADLLPRLVTPTLVLHPRDSLNMPPRESQELAARIPDAQMVLIDGATPLGDASQGMRAIDEFLATLEERSGRDEPLPSLPGNLSSRQLEVLRLLGMGKTNREIATTLVLSERTVERHVADVYAKIGADNRAQAAVYAHDHGLA